jgi:hypothetical protein
MSFTNNDKNISICNERLAALAKFTSAADVVLVDGVSFTQPQVVAAYQSPLDARKAVTGARAAENVAVKKRQAADAERRKVDIGLRAFVVNKFGANSSEAQEFGFAKKPAKQPKVAAKAVAVEKAAATKKARGILGKKARRAIKAPPAPQPAPTPSAAPAPAGNVTPSK